MSDQVTEVDCVVRLRKTVAVVVSVIMAACEASPGESGGRDDMAGHSMDVVVDTTGLAALEVPAEHQAGESLYDATCATCHGEAGTGTSQGPPLIHPVYEPNHHADMAFVLAAQRGVRAHHWRFGDMPPQPGVSAAELAQIIGYIRWLQREAGVY